MTESSWQDLPAGPHLRRVIAQRLGWHLRKNPVGVNGIAYDYLVYNNDDHIVYQREITAEDLQDEEVITNQTWLEAMSDEDCPRWDEDSAEARDLVYGMDHKIWQVDGRVSAWVKSDSFTGSGDTESLALVRAWLAATEDDPAFFH